MHAQTQMPCMSICKKNKNKTLPSSFYSLLKHIFESKCRNKRSRQSMKHVIFIAVAAGARGFSTRGPLLKHTAEYS